MYLYYGLAALGPQMQKYLWWKKYLTTLQLLQFALVMALGLRIMVSDCKHFHRSFLFLNLFHAVLFFYLFSSFYRQSYKKTALSGKNGLTVAATTGPDGASTYARIGGVTITASVHYGANNEEDCFKDSYHGKGSTTAALKAFQEDVKEIKKRQWMWYVQV